VERDGVSVSGRRALTMDTRAMVGVSPRYGTSAGGLALEKGSWCIDQR